MLLTFVYNMNSCLYRQPTSWHGGWLQLHRLQCMNWKLKTQIQSKNCWTSCYITTTISIHRLQSMTWRFRLQIHSQGDALLLSLTWTLCLYRKRTSWHGAWLQLHGLQSMSRRLKTHIFNQKNAVFNSCYTITTVTIHRLQSIAWRFKMWIQSEDAACFWLEYELLLVQAANKLAWRVTTTVAQTPIILWG